MKVVENRSFSVLLIIPFVIALLLITGCTSSDKIDDFLTSGLISFSGEVGSGYPAGYYFNNDGSFSYYVGEYVPLEEDSLVSCRGKWEIKKDTLILTVLEEERNTSINDIWDNLERREKEYQIEYKSIKIVDDGEKKYLSTSEGKLYSLSIEKEYMEILYSLGRSYDEFYQAKNKYYESI